MTPSIKNPKHQVFADAYLRGGSATQAAIDAGYSIRTAGVQAAQLIKKPEIAEYIAHMKESATESTQDLHGRIVQEMQDMAFFNVEDVSRIDDDGDLVVDFSAAESRHYKSVTKIKNKTRHVYDAKGNHIATEKQTEIGLADKYRGLELLGRTLGMFKNDEQRVVVDVADRLLGARARLARARVVDEDGKDVE